MVKRGGDLDEALKERLFRLWREPPNVFPGLVGLEEAAEIELPEALQEFLIDLAGIHVRRAVRVRSANRGIIAN